MSVVKMVGQKVALLALLTVDWMVGKLEKKLAALMVGKMVDAMAAKMVVTMEFQ